VATAAIAAPPAIARPIDGPNEPVRPDPGTTLAVAPDHAPRRVVQTIGDGFDWGSAAIGAGALILSVTPVGFAQFTARHRIGVPQ
jgi:hypothetical protein